MTISAKKRIKKNPAPKKKSEVEFDLKLLKFTSNNWWVSAASYDGKRLKKIDTSSRSIYRYNGFVIKIETGIDRMEQTRAEMLFYRKKLKKVDEKYFPRYITGDVKRGIVVTSYENMYKGGSRTQDNRDIVERLGKKYRIGDLKPNENHNWGVCKERKIPIIYDIGFID